jgi:subtilisin family serine protease
MRRVLTLLAIAALALPGAAAAQLGLPNLPAPPVQLPPALPDLPSEQGLEATLREADRVADRLVRQRGERIERLLRHNSETLDRDAKGEPARRGELLLLDPTASELAGAEQAGFAPLSSEQLDSLGVTVVRLRLPEGVSLAEGEAILTRIAPEGSIAPDNLHFQSGEQVALSLPLLAASAAPPSAATAITAPVGIIDGAPGGNSGVALVKGFAPGAPAPSDHGSAVASLLRAAGVTRLLAADVYGTDRAGGGALAIARGLDWLTGAGAQVISISLTGPRNPLVERAVAAAQRKGAIIVAAVGNDGPAAPPAYPASYSGVLAVTAVDKRLRVLLEAGKPLHLDFAAPGADIRARDKAGKWKKVRGTSFAVPLVAARAANALGRGDAWRATLDREAEDLGAKGPDDRFGRGLLCRRCAGW